MRRYVLLLVLVVGLNAAEAPSPGPAIVIDHPAPGAVIVTGVPAPAESQDGDERDPALTVLGYPPDRLRAEADRLQLERDRLQAAWEAFLVEARDAAAAHNRAGLVVAEAYQATGAEKGGTGGLLIHGCIYFNAPEVIAIDDRIHALLGAAAIMSSNEPPRYRDDAVATIALAAFVMEQRKLAACVEQGAALRAGFAAARDEAQRAASGF